MPVKKTWLLRLPEILQELAGLEVPVLDRAVFERIFGVRRRRAIQLMHFLDGYESGSALLVDRMALLRQLEPLQAGTEFVMEQRRRQRLAEALEKVRRYRTASRVLIRPLPFNGKLTGLPKGIWLEPGGLKVDFHSAEDLFSKLLALAQAAAADFEAFQAAVDGGNQRNTAESRGSALA